MNYFGNGGIIDFLRILAGNDPKSFTFLIGLLGFISLLILLISAFINLGITIFSFGNDNLKEGENKIVISLKKDDNYDYIYLTAIKEEEQTVFNSVTNSNVVEIGNTAPVYVAPLIGASCFLIILTLYAILFATKKSK